MDYVKTEPADEDRCHARIVHLNRVNKAHKEAISPQSLDRLAQTYKVLGDPTRLKIVMALGEGEMCVCDLAALLGISESAASHQIRRLKDLGLVRGRRDGQVLYYSLDDHHVEELIRLSLEHVRE